MRFLIMGDSWGTGEWRKVFTVAKHSPGPSWSKSINPDEWFYNESVPDTDIGHYLRKMGHEAVNIAISGDSNINQLALLRDHLSDRSDYDMIIWFHTEPIRDYTNHFSKPIHRFKNQLQRLDNDFSEFDSYDRIMSEWFDITYYQYQELYDQYQIPFFAVGGMSPLHPVIDDYTFARYKLVDWCNELIFDEYVPHGYNDGKFSSFSTIFPNFNDVRMIKEGRSSLKYIQHTFNHANFPDWGHPDGRSHEYLAAWILEQLII